MRVFVAGATGAVGRRLVPQLLAAGHRVVATTRTESKFGELRKLGAQPVLVDGLDAAAVGEAVAHAEPDAIIHQMTALAGMSDLRRFDRTFATTNALRIHGTDNLLAAAQAAGVRRVVVQSFTGWTYERTGGPVKSEDDPFDPNPPRWQRESLAAIRHLERAVCAAPVEGVVLRYGLFYGPGASEDMVELVRKRRLPIVGAGGGIWSMVHLDDAAAAAVAAVERGAGLYNVVDDDPAPAREWIPAFAAAAQAKPPWRIPVWLGRLAGGSAAVAGMTTQRAATNAKAKRELGWTPRYATWRDGFPATLSGP
jgi:nucleoside-diphosphate-sugar epimerase